MSCEERGRQMISISSLSTMRSEDQCIYFEREQNNFAKQIADLLKPLAFLQLLRLAMLAYI